MFDLMRIVVWVWDLYRDVEGICGISEWNSDKLIKFFIGRQHINYFLLMMVRLSGF